MADQPPESGATRSQRISQASRKRREAKKADLRRQILDAAHRLFLQHGFEQFSLRQVAERIGYSATTIYHHFRDKDHLLYEVVVEGFDTFGSALQRAYDSTAEPAARLEALGRAYIRFGLDQPLYYRLMFMQRDDFLNKVEETGTWPRANSRVGGRMRYWPHSRGCGTR